MKWSSMSKAKNFEILNMRLRAIYATVIYVLSTLFGVIHMVQSASSSSTVFENDGHLASAGHEKFSRKVQASHKIAKQHEISNKKDREVARIGNHKCRSSESDILVNPQLDNRRHSPRLRDKQRIQSEHEKAMAKQQSNKTPRRKAMNKSIEPDAPKKKHRYRKMNHRPSTHRKLFPPLEMESE